MPRALANLQDFLDADSMTDELPEDFDRFTPAVLREKGTKAGHATPSHPLFDLCGRLAELHAEHERSVRVTLFCEARDDVRAALARGKREQALLYFDDLLKGLDQALAGDTGAALAQVIRQRFPVALVDEFQDTDSQQYRIFRRIYRGQKACGLFLIGDPKQAIYAFRGADIFTYMAAREDSQREGQCYTLGVNWRSGSGLVAAVNRLFGAASKPFVYDEHIPFQPVAAAPDADAAPLVLADGPPPPMQFWLLPLTEDNETSRPPGYIRRDSAAEAAASACAGHIAGLLSQADAGKARLGERPLQSADIAVLVRSHREGERMRDALRACGVSSVTLSQDSIFASEDAAELAILLQALGDISDERRLRAALATSLLGRTAEELDRLANDEVAWEALLAQFQGYRDHWLERGFMAALQLLIEEQAIARRLARRPDGERRLGNLLQLLELLQVASTEHPGCEALLRWFADQRAEGRSLPG